MAVRNSLGVLFALMLSLVFCKPQSSTYGVGWGALVVSNGSEIRVESMSDGECDKMEEYEWYSDFHDCFVDRKYKDGGRDLEAIIDRVLSHAETCVERSQRPCELNYEGFKFLMDKVVDQMKDFSLMYMEAIIKGREDIKDLECVENVLTIQTYVECFSADRSLIQEGLICANRRNQGCSREAKATLDRIVRTLLGHPEIELSPTPPSFQEEEPTPEPPMAWYDYIFQPFISAWNWVKSWFG